MPPNTWQRLRANRPLFLGSIALVTLLVAGLALGASRLAGRKAASPTPSPVGAATPTGAATRSWTSPPAMAIDPAKKYTATIVTDKGDIQIQLFADKAPKTVNNFVFLARQGYYDGVTFHRVLADFVAQGGDPTGTGGGGPGYKFEDEIVESLKFDKPGVVAMANSGPNTNGSQFFITYTPRPGLDGGYTIFGQVTAGMDVAKKLTLRNPDEHPKTPGDAIRTIRITEE